MNNTSEHQSNEVPPLFGPWFLYPVATCYISIAVVAVVGNLLVCFAILTNRSLRRKPTNLLLLSLAVSDLLTAAIAMPFDIESLFRQGGWKHGAVMCVAFLTVYLITVPTSILTLLAISVDRYQSLRDPLSRFRRAQFMTQRKALLVIGLIWLYCIIFAFLPIMGWPFLERGQEMILNGFCMVPFSKLYTSLSNFLNFVGPLVVTCVLNIMIYCIARKHTRGGASFKPRQESGQKSKEDAKAHARNLKAAKTTFMFVAAFFFCWQPYSYFSIVANLWGHDNWKTYPSKLFYVLLMFGYLNSALNPFLFAFRNKEFKHTYERMASSVKRRNSRVRRRSTVSLSTLSSDIPESENKNVCLQSVKHKRTTPDPPRRGTTSQAQ